MNTFTRALAGLKILEGYEPFSLYLERDSAGDLVLRVVLKEAPPSYGGVLTQLDEAGWTFEPESDLKCWEYRNP